MNLLFKNLQFSYQKREILKKVQLQFPESGNIAVLGPNGSGKSTFLKLVTGILAPSAGEIFLSDKAFKKLSSEERSTLVSYLPQELARSSQFSVLQFVALSTSKRRLNLGRIYLTTEEEVKIKKTLSLFDATHLFDRPLSTLSGGEWARVQLARVWAQETFIKVLDEPTASLDIKHVFDLGHLLKKEASEGLCLFSTHDLQFAINVSSQFLVIAHGRAELHSREDVLSKKVLDALYGVRFEYITGDAGNIILTPRP